MYSKYSSNNRRYYRVEAPLLVSFLSDNIISVSMVETFSRNRKLSQNRLNPPSKPAALSKNLLSRNLKLQKYEGSTTRKTCVRCNKYSGAVNKTYLYLFMTFHSCCQLCTRAILFETVLTSCPNSTRTEALILSRE